MKPLRPPTALLVLALAAPLMSPVTVEGARPRPAAVAPMAQPDLKRAVQERLVVRFTYDGRPRVVEPHAYGIGPDGEPVLHGYQTAGESVSGGLPGWRTFAARRITDFRLTEELFPAARPDYVEGRPRLDPLWAEAGERP